MTQLVIRRQQRWVRWLLIVGLPAALVTTAWLSFDYGLTKGGYERAAMEGERETLTRRAAALENENAALRERVAVLERSGEIDQRAYAEVKRSLHAQQDELLRLQERLAFYQNIVSSSYQQDGLNVQSFKVREGGQERLYRYTLILSQVMKKYKEVRGTATLWLDGIQDGKPKRLGMKDVSVQAENGLAFQFKYFQTLEGTLLLPPGFAPSTVVVQLQPKGRKETVERTIPWSVVSDLNGPRA